MKFRFFITIFFILFLNACISSPSQSSDLSIRVIDSTGHEITLSSIPERIVIAGRATVMVQDTVFLFPEAKNRGYCFGKPQPICLYISYSS